ncbi:MAG TPA: biotin--[acetyl-CoA-carboxylase] ligase [Methanobacteriaceae archaeon]|nr:biotin--[acetyl-CoA-carboxylase] ligase [Methanobacteriaceae archaeon]
MVKKKILKTLNKKKGMYLKEEEVTSHAGITAEELQNEIESLKSDGYIIDTSLSEGYRLVESPNRLLPYELQRELETKYIGQNVHYFKEVDSTNEVAKKLAENGAVEGTIIIAESQSRGRGRRGKRWLSPEGGVWMTIILRPDVSPVKAPQLTLITGVAVAQTLQNECQLDVGIKWPNDILIGDKKVCGILTEAAADKEFLDYVVVGIGIDLNVNVELFPPELRDGATSLQFELEKEIYSVELVQKFLKNFENIYEDFKEGNFPEILSQWRKLSKTIGKSVAVHKKGRIVLGEAVGITKDGILILEMEDGTLRKIISGECIHRPSENV